MNNEDLPPKEERLKIEISHYEKGEQPTSDSEII